MAKTTGAMGRWTWPVAIAAVVFAVYGNGLGGPFVFDDLASIPENPSIRRLWPLSDVLRTPLGGQSVAGRPVVNLTLALNYAIGGLDVGVYHLWNIATHVACALVLFGCLRRLFAHGGAGREIVGPDALAGAVTLTWAVHPLQSEAVSYITARTESTMALCYLGTLYASLRAAGGPAGIGARRAAGEDGRRRRWAIAAVVACALGMASKESMVTAPLMVACVDRALLFESWREAWRARWRLYAGLAATWLVLAGLLMLAPRAHSAGFVDGLGPGFETGVWTWLLNQAVMVARYLRLAAWPVGLVLDYGYPRPYTFADTWMPFVALALASGLTLVLFARRPRLGLLPLWFFVTLAPSSSVVPIVTEVGAERRMYLPAIAIVVAAGLGGLAVLRRLAAREGRDAAPQALAAALLAIVVTLGAMGTRWRNEEFASPLTLWQTVVERWPGGRAHANLAAMLYADGRRDEALTHLRLAVPELPDAYYDLGAQLLTRRQYDEAIAALEAFLAARPGHVKEPAARDLLGQALMRAGRLDDAAAQFVAITRLDPTYAAAFGRLGDVRIAQDRLQDAVAPLQAYASLTNTANAWRNLGVALGRSGQVADAVKAFSREVTLAPADADARRNLANALVDLRAFAEAEPHAREAVRLKPQDPVNHDLLGLALAGLGRAEEARRSFALALRTDPAYADARAHLEALAGAPAAGSRR